MERHAVCDDPRAAAATPSPPPQLCTTPVAVRPFHTDAIFLSKSVFSLHHLLQNLSNPGLHYHMRPASGASPSGTDSSAAAPLEVGSRPSVGTVRLPFSAGWQPFTASRTGAHHSTTWRRAPAGRAESGGAGKTTTALPARLPSSLESSFYLDSAVEDVGANTPHLCMAPIDGYHFLLSFRDVSPASLFGDARAAAPVGGVATPHRLSENVTGPQPPRDAIGVMRRLEGEQRLPGAASSAFPTLTHMAEALPLCYFDGWVRDYSRFSLAQNLPLLRMAWERKRMQRGEDEQASEAGDAVDTTSRTSSSPKEAKQLEDDTPPKRVEMSDLLLCSSTTERTANSSLAASSGSSPRRGGTTSATSEPPHTGLSSDTPLVDGEASIPLRSNAESAFQIWEEERAMEQEAAQRLVHRFLVCEGRQHAIWALEVRLPSMQVRVVPPAEYFQMAFSKDELDGPSGVHFATPPSVVPPSSAKGNGQEEPTVPELHGNPVVVDGCDESPRSDTAPCSPQSPAAPPPPASAEQLSGRRETRRSASRSVAMVEALPAPLMGGSPGFVDGHFSVAKFRNPCALCWRIDGNADSHKHAVSSPDTSTLTFLHQAPCTTLFISDAGNHAIRYANLQTKLVRTIVGMDGVPGYRDGGCLSSLLRRATAMVWCTAGLLFSDGPNSVVRLITNIQKHSPTTLVPRAAAEEKEAVEQQSNGVNEQGRATAAPPSPSLSSPVSRRQGPSALNVTDAPRVWTLAGAVPTSAASSSGSTYVDSATPSRARFGYISDMAMVVDEAGMQQLLILDTTNHAIRVLTAAEDGGGGGGVATYLGPMDYFSGETEWAVPKSGDNAGGGDVQRTVSRDESVLVSMPTGLISPCQLLACAFVKERSPILFGRSNDFANLPKSHMLAPQPYLHSSSLLLFLANAVSGCVSMVLPVSVPRSAITNGNEATDHRSTPITPSSAEEIQNMLELGMATEGRRTIGETTTPSIKHVLGCPSGSFSTSISFPEAAEAKEVAEDQRLLGEAMLEQASQYVHLRFPWVLPPPVPPLDRRLISYCTCHISGRRHGATTPTSSSSRLMSSSASHSAIATGGSSAGGGGLSLPLKSQLMFASPDPAHYRAVQHHHNGGKSDGAPALPASGEPMVINITLPGRTTPGGQSPAAPAETAPAPAMPTAAVAATGSSPKRDRTSPHHQSSPTEEPGLLKPPERSKSCSPSSTPKPVTTPRTYSAQFEGLSVDRRQQRVQQTSAPTTLKEKETAPEKKTEKVREAARSPRRNSGPAGRSASNGLTPRSMAAHQLMHRRRHSHSPVASTVAIHSNGGGTSVEPQPFPTHAAITHFIHAAYDEAVRRLFHVYAHFATRRMVTAQRGATVAGKDADVPRKVERYSMSQLAFLRFIVHTGYLHDIVATTTTTRHATPYSCRGLADIHGGVKRGQLSKGAAAAAVLLLPLTLQDWRAVAGALYDCGVQTHGYHTITQMDFQSFRRAMLLLHTWHQTVLRQCDNAAAAASDGGSENAWLSAVPLLDSLSAEEVIAAYTEVYERSVASVPFLGSEKHEPEQDHMRWKEICQSKREVNCGTATARTRLPVSDPQPGDEASSEASLSSSLSFATPPVSPIFTSGADLSCDVALRSHGDGAAIDANRADWSSNAIWPMSSDPRGEVNQKLQRSIAAEEVLWLLQKNDASLAQLFSGFSAPVTVNRSDQYQPITAESFPVSSPPSSSQQLSPALRVPPSQQGRRVVPRTLNDLPHQVSVKAQQQQQHPHPGATAEVASPHAHNFLWTIRQLYTMSAAESREVAQRPSISVTVMSFRSFTELWRAVDVYPALMSQTALKQAYMDALCIPLLGSPVNCNEPVAQGVPSTSPANSATSLSNTAESLRGGLCPVRDLSGLTFLCFAEAFVRVALTVFSHDLDKVAYPTTAAKTQGLMQWINKQVTLGLVEQRRPTAMPRGRTQRGRSHADVMTLPTALASSPGTVGPGVFSRNFPLFRTSKDKEGES